MAMHCIGMFSTAERGRRSGVLHQSIIIILKCYPLKRYPVKSAI